MPVFEATSFSTELAHIIVVTGMRTEDHLLGEALKYVSDLTAKRLPETMTFHNLTHTREVFDAVKEICAHEALSSDECFIVQMAAVFHDCGYLFTYTGHEESSMTIASTYLKQEGWSDAMLADVAGCIAATRMPQRPLNLLQQVICDADMYHFARKDYQAYADRLKMEWEIHLNKYFNQLDWDRLNLEVLLRHTYFTSYGKAVLQPLKEQNITLLLFKIR